MADFVAWRDAPDGVGGGHTTPGGIAMSDRNTVIRTANTLSLAAWFGGSLMGLVGLPKASAAAVEEGVGRDGAARAEGRAWSAWQPLQAGAVASQLASGAALTIANRHRVV